MVLSSSERVDDRIQYSEMSGDRETSWFVSLDVCEFKIQLLWFLLFVFALFVLQNKMSMLTVINGNLMCVPDC